MTGWRRGGAGNRAGAASAGAGWICAAHPRRTPGQGRHLTAAFQAIRAGDSCAQGLG